MSSADFDPAIDNLVIHSRKEIVFIEDNVPDLSTLIEGIGAGKEVAILDSTKDGLRQIADALAGRSGIDALHIVSHGVAGSVDLGALLLDAHNLGAHGAELQAIRQGMAAGGDILLYGCDIGAGSAGQAFVDQLAIATGADVAASSNLTGSAALGGDWNLEISSGHIETPAVVDASLAALYQQTLNITSVNVDFDTYSQIANHGGRNGPQDDVVVRVNGDANYLLKIDGATQNVATYGGGYVVSDSRQGVGETMLTFNFVNGQVFSPTSIDVTNYQLSTPSQHLVFKAYDPAGNYLGQTFGDTNANQVGFDTIFLTGLAGLTNIAKLTLTGDPTVNGGKLVYLAFDNFQLTNIQPAVDTTPPAAPGRPVLDTGSDSGTLGDGITNKPKPTITGSGAEAGATVKLYDSNGVTELGSAVASGGGNWSIVPTAALASGAHSLTAKAIDAAGNVSAASLPLNITIDTTPPTLSIGSGASTLKSGETTTITFNFSEDPGAGFTSGNVTVSGGLLGAFNESSGNTRTATFTPTANFEGNASITVAAGAYRDVAGNNGAASSAPSITIDTRAPAAPAVPDLASVSDSGNPAAANWNTDNVTNVSLPTFGGAAGSAEAGATVRVYDGAALIATTTANANGSWSVASNVVLAEGAHAITATATDAAGNTGAASGALTVTIDRTPPAAPGAPDLAAADDSGDSSTDNITKAATTVFSGGAAEAGAIITLYDTNGSVLATTTADGSGNWSKSVALSEGAHNVTATATDSAGNESAPSPSLAVVVDRTAPLTMAASAILSNDTGASSTDMVTSVANGQTVSGLLNANLVAGEHVEVSLDNGASWTTASASVGSNAWSVPATLSASNTLQVRVVDAAGNAGTAYTRAYVLDTSAPAAPSTPDLDTASDSGTSHTDDVTGNKTPTFSGTAEANATVTLYDGATAIGSVTAAGDGKWQITSNIELGQGNHSITAAATDLAGNTGAPSAALSVFIETRTPSTGIASLAFSADTGSSAADLVTNMASQTISGTLDANLASGERVEVSFDNGASWTSATASVGSNAWSLPAMLAAGTHTLQVRVANSVDNSGPVHSQAYTLDQAAPSVTITSDAAHLKAGDTATVTFTFSEDPGNTFTWDGSGGDVVVSGGTLSALSGSGAERTAIFTPSANTDAGSASISVPSGAYRDLAGNNGGGNSLALTYDTLAPNTPSAPVLATGDDTGSSNSDAVTNSSTLHLSGSADSGSTVKLYDGATEIATVTASGGTYSFTLAGVAEGNHTYSALAVDAAGNTSAVSAGQAVLVDRTPPSTTVAGAALSADSGASATDMITKEAVQTISGTLSANLTAGERVMVSLNNGATWIQASASVGSNNWDLAGVILSGSNTLKVQVFDLAGNGGPVYTHAYALDTTAPAAPSMPDLDTASDSGSSHTDNITGVTLPSFSGTAEVGATVRLFDGGIEIGSDVAVDGTWHITTSSATPLSQGTHNITAIATDLAGNSGTNSAPLEVTVITAAPATTVTGIALANDSGTPGDFVTNQAIDTVSGTLSANLRAGERVQVSTDGGDTWSSATSAAGSNTWSTVVVLANGTHDIKVRVVDAVDNPGPVTTQAYTLDNFKPAVFITSSASTLKAGETANITFTFDEDPGASFGSSDISVSGGTLSALSGTGTTRTAIFTPDDGVNGGTASIAVKADSYQDLAGNLGIASMPRSITFDTLVPGAASAPDLDKDSDKGASDTDNLTNQQSLVFRGTAEAGATVKLYDSDGTTEIGSGTATGGNWTIATTTLGEGSHSVTAKVLDAVGNVSAASGATVVTVDITRPTLAIASDVSQLKTGQTASITFTFSEDPGTSFTDADIAVSGGTLSALQGTGTVRTAIFTPTANTDSGTASIGVSAGIYQDAAGNDGTGGTTPSLHFDTLAPAAPSAPAFVDNGISNSDGIVTDASPVFRGTAEDRAIIKLYDADSGALLQTSLPALGGVWFLPTLSPMSEGTHRLYATATDAAGNVSAPSAITTVTIDTIAPPKVTISSYVSKVKIGETATITFTFAADPGAEFSLANVAPTSAGSFGPLSGTGLTRTAVFTPYPNHDLESAYIHIVDYHDAAGNFTYDSTSLTLLVDTKAPGAPSTPVLNAASDTGSSSSDRITSDTTPVFSGTKDVGTTVTLYDSDGSVLGSVYEMIGAWGIESATLSEGTHTITAKQTDSLGNVSVLSNAVTVIVDTHADALVAPVLDLASDSAAKGDGITSVTTPTLTGSAEAYATVTLYDSDGSTVLGTGTADAGGAWSITSSALAAGAHDLSVRQVDLAGNASAASPVLHLNIDDAAPALAAPVLAAASDSGILGDGITKTTAPVFSGTAKALAQVTLYDGATAIGSVQADADGAWQITAATLADGVHAITARQVDLAGNESAAGTAFSLTVDTAAPAAPSAPTLKAASDTGNIGDGVTENTDPVIEGTALANTLVTLYDTVGKNTVKLGTVMTDAAGKWSIAAKGLPIGVHTLSATLSDAAGNESAAGSAFVLRIMAPPEPVSLIDGMPVKIQPISLPGNVQGSAVSIPVVDTGRTESTGQAGVADIPLATSNAGGALLLAQLAPGYGLSASGASVPAASAAELLIASIKAATPNHAPADQGHLTGNGQSFLAALASSNSLLVETVKPVSSAAPSGTLTLSGPSASAGQSTALVIDAGGLAAGSTIALQQVNFAAVIGAANVTAGSSMVLSGDGASQHFTVAAGGAGSVFAGGGSDVLSVAAAPATGAAPAAGTALLHGGQASDAAAFSGARADYNLEFHNGYVMVSAKAAPDVKAMVVNVEQLQFSDTSIAVQNAADMDAMAGIYQTVLGRQADVMGIEYWANVHQAGASWGAVALSMITSNEHAASHEGFNGMAAHDIALLYTAIFNREADAGGMAFWTDAMGRGMTLEQVASSFVQSVEMIGHQRTATDWDFSVG